MSTLQTNYNSLIWTAPGINSTASNHSTSTDNLNNMEIGGRSLITSTRLDKLTISAMAGERSVQVAEESAVTSGKAMQTTCVLGGTDGVYHDGSCRLKAGKRYT